MLSTEGAVARADDVASFLHEPSACAAAGTHPIVHQRLVVRVQHKHGREVFGADADNDDGQRQRRRFHHLGNGLFHVVDDTVRDDEQNLV